MSVTITVGPIALTTTLTTNIFTPGSLSGGTNFSTAALNAMIRRLAVINKTGSPATVSLWLGGSAGNVAGTEYLFQGTSVPANSYLERYPYTKLLNGIYIVGGAGTLTALSIEMVVELSL